MAFRPPAFWKTKPDLWFTHVESLFASCGITNDDIKYHHIVATIECEVLSQIKDFVLNPPESDKYNFLKKRLITQFADYEEKQLGVLLEGLHLADQQPSQLLREMRDITFNRIEDQKLKSLWIQRLPHKIQQILTISNGDLSELALMADKIHELMELTSHVHTCPTSNNQFHLLEQQIAELRSDVDDLFVVTDKLERRSRSRSRNTCSSTKSRNRSVESNNNVCWYHYRFKDKAKKCKQPCWYQE